MNDVSRRVADLAAEEASLRQLYLSLGMSPATIERALKFDKFAAGPPALQLILGRGVGRPPVDKSGA